MNKDKTRIKELERQLVEAKDACPCRHTTPCLPRCTCVNLESSTGCLRCAKYGSKKQQKAVAERLATYIDNGARLQDFEKRLDDANDVIWDEADPYTNDGDVEHVIHSHADTLPERFRKLVAAIDKIRQITNWRSDIG
jgi:hypothetical protein